MTHDSALTFHFLRHGATEPNLRGLRCGGDLDVPLAELGRDQVHAAAQRIRAMDIGVGVIVCSALKRARETATILSEVLDGVPIAAEPLLDERRLGEWNLRPIAETEPMLRQGLAPSGGESEQAFVARIAVAIEGLRKHLPSNPLVVGSKGVGRVLNSMLGGAGHLNLGNGEIAQFTVQRARSSMDCKRSPT